MKMKMNKNKWYIITIIFMIVLLLVLFSHMHKINKDYRSSLTEMNLKLGNSKVALDNLADMLVVCEKQKEILKLKYNNRLYRPISWSIEYDKN